MTDAGSTASEFEDLWRAQSGPTRDDKAPARQTEELEQWLGLVTNAIRSGDLSPYAGLSILVDLVDDQIEDAKMSCAAAIIERVGARTDPQMLHQAIIGVTQRAREIRDHERERAVDRAADLFSMLDDILPVESDGQEIAIADLELQDGVAAAVQLGVDGCDVARVEVQVGARLIEADWILAAFESRRPIERFKKWVDPRNWATCAPLLIRNIQLVSGSPAGSQWRATMFEVAQAVHQQFRNFLDCAFYDDPAGLTAATFRLDPARPEPSENGALLVNQGYVLVKDLGPSRRIEALKILKFRNDIGISPEEICWYWRQWLPVAARCDFGDLDPDTCDLAERWRECTLDAADFYTDYWKAVCNRIALDADYDLVRDGMSDARVLWTRVAQDWARFVTSTIDTAGDIGRTAPPSTPRRTTGRVPGAGTQFPPNPAGGEPDQNPPFTPGGPARRDVVFAASIGPRVLKLDDLASISHPGPPVTTAVVVPQVVPAGQRRATIEIHNARDYEPGGYVGALLDRQTNLEIARVFVYLARAGLKAV